MHFYGTCEEHNRGLDQWGCCDKCGDTLIDPPGFGEYDPAEASEGDPYGPDDLSVYRYDED